jgi:transposase
MEKKDAEEKRKEAVKCYLAGEPAGKVAKDLGVSRMFVHKWVNIYRKGGEEWYRERSRRPKNPARLTDPETEKLVLEVRERLENTRYAQTGAFAIQWELKSLGVYDIPKTWTINRILSRNGKVKRKERYRSKKKAYPYFPSHAPNMLHQADFYGPGFIKRDGSFYSLNAMDIARHKVALSPLRGKRDESVAGSVLYLFSRLGIPRYFQIDNELVFHGSNRYPRSYGLVLKLLLFLGVEPVFIPPREPWRNGAIERFQDAFEKKFFLTREYPCFEELVKDAGGFEEFHNSHHRYDALGGKTPYEYEKAVTFSPVFPKPGLEVPGGKPKSGTIHLIRLIRSSCLLDVFTEKFLMPENLMHEYVVATVCIEEEKLTVTHFGETVLEIDYRLT